MNSSKNFLTRRLCSSNALLLVVCLAQFMVILDVAIVNVALPSIRNGLGFSTTGLQWVVNAYTLTFAGLLMLGGRSADLLGRRRVFLAGTAMFALSSLACALASSRGLMISARAVQGIAGAVTSPATLAIITSTLPEGPERNRGLGLWGAMGALGASSGALLGGVLTQTLGWQAIFAVNVPLGAFVVALGLIAIPAIKPIDGPRHFDALGATLITAGLIGITFGIVRTDTLGWGSPGVLGPLAAGVLLLGAFVFVEAKVAQAPLVPLSIFRLPQLRTANIVVLLMYAANFPAWFFITLYLQQVLHYDAIEAGLSFLPMTLSIFVGSTLAPRVVARFGARRVISFGMLAMLLGMLWLTRIGPGGNYLGTVLGGALLTALGNGLHPGPGDDRRDAGCDRSAERARLGGAEHLTADGRGPGPGDPEHGGQHPDRQRDRRRRRAGADRRLRPRLPGCGRLVRCGDRGGGDAPALAGRQRGGPAARSGGPGRGARAGGAGGVGRRRRVRGRAACWGPGWSTLRGLSGSTR